MAKKKSAKKKPAKKAGKKKPAGKPVARKPAAAKKSAKKAVKPAAKKKAPAKKVAAKKPTKPTPPKKAAKTGAKTAAKPKPAAKAPTGKPKAVGRALATPTAKAPSVAKVSAAASRKQHIPDIERPTGMYGGVMLSDNPKPFPRSSPYSKGELKALREALASEKARLRRELASLEELAMGGRDRSDDAARFPSESSEYSAEMQAAETIMGVRTLEEERLEQVTEALERIDSKRNYGLCLACGNKIGIERLIAKPHAHLCMDCRRTFERKRSQEGY